MSGEYGEMLITEVGIEAYLILASIHLDIESKGDTTG